MLKIGLIGCGFMGGMHAACYKVIPDAEVVAVADIRKEKAEEIAKVHGAQIFLSGVELINSAEVDVIDICLPTFLHTEHAIMAMKKGRNVFIEKPVCLTKEEGELLLATEKETGVKVQVGQVIRSWDEYVWLKEVTDRKEYGAIQTAVFKRLSNWPAWGWENWLHDAKRSGSMALDLHIHDVDFMRYLMGEPQAFHSSAMRDEKGIIEQIFTTFTYDNAIVTVEGCWDYPRDFPFDYGYRVKFEKATAVLDTSGLTVYPKSGGQMKPELIPAWEGDNEIGGNLSSLGGYYNELKYFIDRLNADEPLVIALLCEGVKSVELVLKEIESVGGAQIE